MKHRSAAYFGGAILLCTLIGSACPAAAADIATLQCKQVTSHGNNIVIATIDLGSGAITWNDTTYNIKNKYKASAISSAQIKWSGGADHFALNRITGALTVGPESDGKYYHWNCEKAQQKP